MTFNPYYNFNEPGAGPPPRNDSVRHRKHGGPEYNHALHDLMDNMYEISDDPSGSDPADYLSPEDAEVCRRVTALASNIGWRNANEFGRMIVPRNPESLLWKRPIDSAVSEWRKVFLLKQKGEAHRGYVFGILGASPDQLVALCEDGLLRSYRADELEKSKGSGWGRLPDPDKLKAALTIGMMHGVEYADFPTNPKSKTLAGKLLENVPADLLDEARLRHFGLKGYKRLYSADLLEENPLVPA